MCDSNQDQVYNCNDQQFSVQPCNFSGNEQYENAENCENCQEFSYPPTDCNQCSPPRNTTWQFKQPKYEICCAPQSFEQNQHYVTSHGQCDPFDQRCDPCEPLGPCQMPLEDCQPRSPCPRPEPCSPMCSPYQRCRYVQPARRESFKPVIKYQRPTVPMTDDTIYKQSFDYIDPKTAACCRLPPVRPVSQLRTACGDFARDTVTTLSFRPVVCHERTKPIYPFSRSLLGTGPMQSLTTQKHDFVPKFSHRQPQFTPRHNIFRACGNVENATIQRLSFMAPDKTSRVKSYKPIITYRPPELPMEFETTQKLSFMPVCPQPKEDLPWARKAKYCPPLIKFARDTVNKLSYQPPGCFIDDRGYCCPEKCDMPRAAC